MTRGLLLLSVLAAPLLAACAPAPDAMTPSLARTAAAPAMPAVAAVRVAAAPGGTDAHLPLALVHKSPTCGCCTAWVEHLRNSGFTVQVDEREDLNPLKGKLGVPLGKGSCHTAEIGGLVVEGHVPAEDIKRLLASRGDARGLVLPGMPMGSPGMETPDGRVQRYVVEQINADGSTTPFAVHGK